jgi:hypothetical protein
MILTRKTEELGEKPVPVSLPLTANPTWTDLGVNWVSEVRGWQLTT